jgi:hypothetical protein
VRVSVHLTYLCLFGPGSEDDREAFLSEFYPNAKAAFIVFDRQVKRARNVLYSGFGALLSEIHDPASLKALIVMIAAADPSPVVTNALNQRALHMSVDFPRLFNTTGAFIGAWRDSSLNGAL